MRNFDAVWPLLDSLEGEKFCYGKHDCCTLVARCLDVMLGTNFLTAILAEYKDEPTASALIFREGGMLQVVSYFLGPERPVHHARRGDVILLETDTAFLVGVCVGDAIAVAGDGVLFYPLSSGVCCWCVDE